MPLSVSHQPSSSGMTSNLRAAIGNLVAHARATVLDPDQSGHRRIVRLRTCFRAERPVV